MKLTNINLKTFKPLHNLIAYKWLKIDRVSKKSLIILLDSINDGGGEGRMGNKYTCEAIAIGPDVKIIKPGDKFILHEYDKVDQRTPWNVEDIMFAEESVISLLLEEGADPFMSQAKPITNKMMEDYEEY